MSMSKAPQKPMRAPFPSRESFPEEDRSEYDYVFQRVQRLTGGRIDEFPYVGACLNAPPFAASVWRLSGRVLATGATGETYSHRDREHINLVLAFDSGHYTMLDGHLNYAVEVAGISPETVQALWEGRDDDLPADSRQLVDYIRAYVNGTVTDEMWAGLVERFGSVRGAVEYTYVVAYGLINARSMQAWAIPSASRQEMAQKVRNLQPLDEETRRLRAESDPLNDPQLLADMRAG